MRVRQYEAGGDIDVGALCVFDGERVFERVPHPGPGSFSNRPLSLEAITVCVECGKPINPRTRAEYEACESLGVHLGECWHEHKRRAASPRGARLLLEDE